jgi:hypothetical protein
MSSSDYAEAGLGYRRDLEDFVGLAAGAQAQDTFICGDIDPKQLGSPMGLIDVIKGENQGQMNSCAGNSGSSILEACLWHQSGGTVHTQLSRMFAYVNGQRHCGINGDSGATLKGVIDGFQAEGCPKEEFAPYTGQYYTRFGQEAQADARNQKLKSYMAVTDVEQVYEGLAKKIGGLYLGINWVPEARNPEAGGYIHSFRSQGGRGGYHAVCMLDWCEEKDNEGYPYLRLFNSHGSNYGDRGTSKWSRKATQQCVTSNDTTCFFLSEMDFIRPRFDYKNTRWTA